MLMVNTNEEPLITAGGGGGKKKRGNNQIQKKTPMLTGMKNDK